MANFYEKIRSIEAQMNKLKTLGLTSSSSLSIIKKDITLPFQLVGTSGTPGYYSWCSSSKLANVKIVPKSNKPAFATLYTKNPEIIADRAIFTTTTYDSTSYVYRVNIVGSDADLARINSGQTLPSEDYEFEIFCTDDFTYSIVWEDNA